MKTVRTTYSVRVTRSTQPFACRPDLNQWHLFANYPDPVDAHDGAERALKEGYTFAKIVTEIVVSKTGEQ